MAPEVLIGYMEVRGGVTIIDTIGKKPGGLMRGTPKYLLARTMSNLEYAALAKSVQGGLFPVSIELQRLTFS